MPLSRCKVFNRQNDQCGLTAEHPGQDHSFGRPAPGPPNPPPRRDLGERYVNEQQDVVIDAKDVLVGWVSPHRQIACTCANTPPTMPTLRTQHLEWCSLAPLQALVAENERLRKALEFYAHPEMWIETKLKAQTGPDGSVYIVAVPVLLEMGKTARDALGIE